jgi:hypothetical protein
MDAVPWMRFGAACRAIAEERKLPPAEFAKLMYKRVPGSHSILRQAQDQHGLAVVDGVTMIAAIAEESFEV